MSDNREQDPVFYSAGQVAEFCRVDLKTIHNWVNKRDMPHFRTPGGHLRFERARLVEFLNSFGYPLPKALQTEQPKEAA